MARSRFPVLLPLLLALSAGLGALSPSFPIDPLPPAFNREGAPKDPPVMEKRDPSADDNGTAAPV